MSYKTTRKGKEGKRKRKGSEWGCVGLLVLQKTSICCDEGCRWGSQRLQCAQGGKPGFGGKHSKNRNVVFWGFFFTAQLTRQEVLQRESGHGNIRRTEKKSNAYFGKTLVRLACNQEKNKEQKNQIEKWNPKNETNCKKKQLTVPTEELNSLYQMVCIIIMACSSSSSSSSEERDGVHSVMWRNENDLKNPTEISGDRWGKGKKGDGVWWLVSSVRIPDFQRFKFACDEKCWWELR